jgi:WD40 repeat protein
LDFSKNENFLVSAGGLEDKNTIVVWNVETGKATYSYSFSGNSPISSVRFYNRSEEKLIVVQESNVHLVTLEPAKRKVKRLYI